MNALTDHDRRLLRKLSIRLEGAGSQALIDAEVNSLCAERKILDGTLLANAIDELAVVAEERVRGTITADQAKAAMQAVWEKPGVPQALPFRGPEWTLAMEKKLCDRVQVVLSDPRMTLVLQAFGAEVFRRSSIFHGLDAFLDESGVRGGTCFEIGTWNGLTAITLSRYFDRVITVDIAHNAMKHEIIARLGIDNIRCFDVADNADKARIAAAHDFDFAYLDGDHAHDTEADFALVEHCGRVLFHEVWPFQKPVWSRVHRLLPSEVTFGGDGLALWRKASADLSRRSSEGEKADG